MARIQTTQAREAVDRALALLAPTPAPEAKGDKGKDAGKGATTAAGARGSAASIQASDARSVLDLLVASDPAELLSGELNLKVMTQSLFDWHGTRRSTKPLLHAFHNALQVPGRYDHAVELTAFLSALSPLLESDRLARLYDLASQVESVYAPARYTVSLSNKLQGILSAYPQARIEQLVQTLWIDSHNGRWWDMTDGVVDDAAGDGEPEAGPDQAQVPAAHEDAYVDPVAQLIDTGRATWSPRAAKRFAKSSYDEQVHDAIKAYVRKANSGDDVEPDLQDSGLMSRQRQREPGLVPDSLARCFPAP